jgi:excisionase family DNA binding protein
MLKESKPSFAILCLSVYIIISANIIANGMKTNGEYISTGLQNASQKLSNSSGSPTNSNDESVVYNRNTYNLTTAALYLGISQSRLIEVTDNKDSGIPYVKIGSDYVFSKNALDEWLKTARFEMK